MPFRSKRSIAGFSNVQKKANNENTKSEKTYNKKLFQERETEILEAPLRSGTEKAKKADYCQPNHATLFETSNLTALINQTCCSQCKSKGTLQLITTSMSGLSTYFDLICSNCTFQSRKNQSCSTQTNSKLALATKFSGLQKAQAGLYSCYNPVGTYSQSCGSALIAVCEDSFKIIGSSVTKRAQETPEGTKVKGNVVWNTPAQHLEGINCDIIIEKFLKPLANLFDIELSMEQDLKSVNKIAKAAKKCIFNILIRRDTAHIVKNNRKKIIKILKDASYFSDATGK